MVIVSVQVLSLLVAFDAPVLVGGRDSAGVAATTSVSPLPGRTPLRLLVPTSVQQQPSSNSRKCFPDERTWVPSEL